MPVHDRRSFLCWAAASGAALTTLDTRARDDIAGLRARLGRQDPKTLATDEKYWRVVRKAYRQSPKFLNLESGYYSAMPTDILVARRSAITRINERASHYLRGEFNEEREGVRKTLAGFAGVDPEETALVRNTTEALNVVIMGLPLQRGDEIVFAKREYPSMQQAIYQRADREGVVPRVVTVPYHPKSDGEIVAIYEKAITKKTRVILVSHLIYLTGQVLPVRKIADMAHRHGVEVICDGAHSFAHLDYKIPELGADYFGCSLHKWLSAPLGNGLLWVKRDRIEKVWPLFGDIQRKRTDIRKLEHFGTHPPSAHLGIVDAIRFIETVGRKNKEERLRYLKNRWAEAVTKIDGAAVNTPLQDAWSCAIANFRIDKRKPRDVAVALYKQFGIFTVAVDSGVRVSPNLFNGPEDVDRLVAAVRKLASA